MRRDLQFQWDKLPDLRRKPQLVPKFIWKILYNIMFTTKKDKKVDKLNK